MTTKTTTIIPPPKSSSPSPSSISHQEQTAQAQLTRLERKIAIATEGQVNFVIKKLRSLYANNKIVGLQNIEAICDYTIAMNAEVNPSLMHKRNQMQVLCLLSEHHNNQILFSDMTSNDILSYMDTLRKPEASDPNHAWIGTYNLRRTYFLRFFKWLYNPNLRPQDRPTPNKVMGNILQLKRLEHTTIKPTDLWTADDFALFLRYCPSKRDKAYFAIAYDTSCRPSEILKLRIRDVVFMASGTSQYAQIVVNGKTGNRTVPLIPSVPHIKNWIDDHPQGRNPNAFLIPSFDRQHRKFGDRMQEKSLNEVCKKYKLEFFPKLLEDPKVPPEDKQKIRELLKKPFNPYLFRHSALTTKSKELSDRALSQHAGWTINSDMPRKYIHYRGNESNEILLNAYGIVTDDNKDNILLPDTLRPKSCPNCNEPNIPDCKFCSKCRMVMNYEAYTEAIEEQKKKDQQLDNLTLAMRQQQQVQEIQQRLLNLIANNMNIQITKDVMTKELQDKDSPLNAEEFKHIPYKKKIELGLEAKDDVERIVKNNVIPAFNDLVQNATTNPKKSKEAAKRLLNDKEFMSGYFFNEEDLETYKQKIKNKE